MSKNFCIADRIASMDCMGHKARSHGAIFLFQTAMQKMDCVDVNESVHMVWFHVCAMHWCVLCLTQLGSSPILCNCDVWFQCKYVGNHIQTHRTLWTKSLNRKQHSISWYNKSQSHIAPCERACNVIVANRPNEGLHWNPLVTIKKSQWQNVCILVLKRPGA